MSACGSEQLLLLQYLYSAMESEDTEAVSLLCFTDKRVVPRTQHPTVHKRDAGMTSPRHHARGSSTWTCGTAVA